MTKETIYEKNKSFKGEKKKDVGGKKGWQLHAFRRWKEEKQIESL